MEERREGEERMMIDFDLANHNSIRQTPYIRITHTHAHTCAQRINVLAIQYTLKSDYR